MIKKILFGLCLLCLSMTNSMAQRQVFNLNNDWQFRYGYEVQKNKSQLINLPHTWNTQDALGGNINYYRGLGVYEKELNIKKEWEHQRLFIRFLGANLITNVFINGKHIGEHRGGYTAFAFEISDYLKYGEKNHLMVKVNNAPQLDVMPLLGDFNFYGGIYRDVQLFVTHQNCISLLDYGSEGVYLHPENVSEEQADIRAIIKTESRENVALHLRVLDHTGKEIFQQKTTCQPSDQPIQDVSIPIRIQKPHLWKGTQDPYVYTVEVSLFQEGKKIDQVVQPLGLRYFHIDPNKGLFLNGKHLQIKGVCRHQDRPELGNALASFHHLEDIEIMKDMGANSLRMSHYPHDPYMYELCNQEGFVVWSEIPFVGPGGYVDKGFVDSQSFKENGKQQLIEMIRQNINHPSILMWGLFNELKEVGDNPITYVKELNALVKKEDPSRITTAASNIDGELNTITDIIAWNKYFGWYDGEPSGIGQWADQQHKEMPNTPIGISEYGAGASIVHQEEHLRKANPTSYWHPENWQTYFHEQHWEAINERPFIWGSYIWNLFDFGAAHRTEGEKNGKNDKGIVTFDRKDKKDAYYFYKANWNKTVPVLYIADRRITYRTQAKQRIKVYSNQKEVTLWHNNKKYKNTSPDAYARFYFELELVSGKNEIKVESGKHTDRIFISLEERTL